MEFLLAIKLAVLSISLAVGGVVNGGELVVPNVSVPAYSTTQPGVDLGGLDATSGAVPTR